MFVIAHPVAYLWAFDRSFVAMLICKRWLPKIAAEMHHKVFYCVADSEVTFFSSGMNLANLYKELIQKYYPVFYQFY